jgi:membrane protease YdiL (CAAX protease family)
MKVWGLAATLGLAILAFGLGQLTGVGVLPAIKAIDPRQIDHDGTAVAAFTLIANVIQTVTLVLAVRMLGTNVLEYLGIDIPRWRDVTLAVMALVVVVVVGDLLIVGTGRDLVQPFELEISRSARADGTLPVLWLALIFVAPIGEELLFRGFLFRGLIHQPRDRIPAVLMTALIWAALHVQYDWLGVVVVFAVGVMLGYIRLRTGSTTLAILVHVLLNAESVVETIIALGAS